MVRAFCWCIGPQDALSPMFHSFPIKPCISDRVPLFIVEVRPLYHGTKRFFFFLQGLRAICSIFHGSFPQWNSVLPLYSIFVVCKPSQMIYTPMSGLVCYCTNCLNTFFKPVSVIGCNKLNVRICVRLLFPTCLASQVYGCVWNFGDCPPQCL